MQRPADITEAQAQYDAVGDAPFDPDLAGPPLTSEQHIEEDPHAFARYLAHFRDAEPVGIRCAPTACPLARYLASKGVEAPVIIDGQYGRYICGVTLFDQGAVHLGHPHFLPEWAATFVELIDGTDTPAAIVSAAEARQALRHAATLARLSAE